MKRNRQAFLLVVLFLTFAQNQAKAAETSVNISNNGNGASSSVEVHNDINSSTSRSSNSTSKTNIRIEANGKVKTYESENGGSIHIESDDGTAKVDINNNNVKGISTSSFVTPTATMEDSRATSGAHKNIAKAQDKLNNLKEKQKSFFDKLQEYIRSLFSKIQFKL